MVLSAAGCLRRRDMRPCRSRDASSAGRREEPGRDVREAPAGIGTANNPRVVTFGTASPGVKHEINGEHSPRTRPIPRPSR
jgi:hypothetical protein